MKRFYFAIAFAFSVICDYVSDFMDLGQFENIYVPFSYISI